MGSTPKSTNVFRTSGSCNTSDTTFWISKTLSIGMPLGAANPNQFFTTYPGTVSAAAGKSGSIVNLLLSVVASAFSLPLFKCGKPIAIASKVN